MFNTEIIVSAKQKCWKTNWKRGKWDWEWI